MSAKTDRGSLAEAELTEIERIVDEIFHLAAVNAEEPYRGLLLAANFVGK